MTAPARFTQSDVTRVMKGALAAGIRNFQVVIDPTGNIVFTATKDGAAKANSMDKLLGR